MTRLQAETTDNCVLSWYAIQVRARHEKVVAELLQYRGYEHFLPLRKNPNHRPARDKDTALFPGYLFCRLNLSDRRVPVVTTPGVICLVGFGERPTPIPDQEIQALQAIINSALPTETASFFHPGQRVEIMAGPLRGVEGILDAIKRPNRLVVRITLLQRAVSVEVDDGMALPCDHPKQYSSLPTGSLESRPAALENPLRFAARDLGTLQNTRSRRLPSHKCCDAS